MFIFWEGNSRCTCSSYSTSNCCQTKWSKLNISSPRAKFRQYLDWNYPQYELGFKFVSSQKTIREQIFFFNVNLKQLVLLLPLFAQY